MITTDDLPLADGVHFTTHSYQVIGERFAEAFFKLTTGSAQCASARLNAALRVQADNKKQH
jgi:hypothetical protein